MSFHNMELGAQKCLESERGRAETVYHQAVNSLNPTATLWLLWLLISSSQTTTLCTAVAPRHSHIISSSLKDRRDQSHLLLLLSFDEAVTCGKKASPWMLCAESDFDLDRKPNYFSAEEIQLVKYRLPAYSLSWMRSECTPLIPF